MTDKQLKLLLQRISSQLKMIAEQLEDDMPDNAERVQNFVTVFKPEIEQARKEWRILHPFAMGMPYPEDLSRAEDQIEHVSEGGYKILSNLQTFIDEFDIEISELSQEGESC